MADLYKLKKGFNILSIPYGKEYDNKFSISELVSYFRDTDDNSKSMSKVYKIYSLIRNHNNVIQTDYQSSNKDIITQGIYYIKLDGSMRDSYMKYLLKYFITKNVYTDVYIKQDKIIDSIVMQLLDPYKDLDIINIYLYKLLDMFYVNNSDSTDIEFKYNDDNIVTYKYDLSKEKSDPDDSKRGYYKEVDDDNNITIIYYGSDDTIKYIIKNIEIIYKINGTEYKYKAKDSKYNILFPNSYNVTSDFPLSDFAELLYYSLKIIFVTSDETNISYTFSNITWFSILNKFIKD